MRIFCNFKFQDPKNMGLEMNDPKNGCVWRWITQKAGVDNLPVTPDPKSRKEMYHFKNQEEIEAPGEILTSLDF